MSQIDDVTILHYPWRNYIISAVAIKLPGFNIVAGQTIGEHKRVRVEVFNDLGDGLNLTIHCKSGDVDLGVHVIKYPNGFFSFDFKPNFWGTSLYFCGFRWKDSELKWFDIYVFDRDHPRCSDCFWKIRPDGACQLNYGTKEYDLCYPWNPKLQQYAAESPAALP
ncbi:S-protein homolog 5-like [Corylus avellana]|uniref:S-protein homolog 5-like n=1 Tax=Corylus avellana TaxID=13451 RepID=UPI00286B81E8|nr:S-protein homolog 5-like [Corylus avellana]